MPAFALREKLKVSNIDPRKFIVYGDSETALSAIDTLRQSFTGEIVLVTCSPYGAFENTDVLRRKFHPLSQNETFFVEDDFLKRAQVIVKHGEIKHIDNDKGLLYLHGEERSIQYDKILLACGAYKRRLKKEYSNVYYLEDRQSHARVHNEILKAKQITIMGGTLEAY